jgi:hypothetical protein
MTRAPYASAHPGIRPKWQNDQENEHREQGILDAVCPGGVNDVQQPEHSEPYDDAYQSSVPQLESTLVGGLNSTDLHRPDGDFASRSNNFSAQLMSANIHNASTIQTGPVTKPGILRVLQGMKNINGI